ncbi:MAG: tetratricopeptide repeat protein [Planctomycetia bacterium]|nr:tetratricopeptide repeat protein [Planctomycetia bacterium]
MKTEILPLNVRLLAVLVFGGLALAVGVFFLHAYQMQRHSAFYLDVARSERARIEQCDGPQQKLEQGYKASDAYDKYLMPVLREAPERKDVRRRMVEMLFGLEQYSSAIEHIRLLCETPKDREGLQRLFDRYSLNDRLEAGASPSVVGGPDSFASLFEFGTERVDREKLLKLLGDDFWMLSEDSELLSICGQCQAGLNRPESAVKSLEKSIVLVPRILETYRHLADQLRKLDKADVADYWMTEMVDSNRDSFQALRMRGEYRKSLIGLGKGEEATSLARGAMSDAAKSLQKAGEQLQKKAVGGDAAAGAAKALGDALEEAAKVAPPADNAMTPQYAGALVKVAQAAKAAGDVVKADVEMAGIRDALTLAAGCAPAPPTQDPGDATANVAIARDFASAAIELSPKDAAPYLILAEIEQRAGRPKEAIECLRQGRKATGDNPEVLWRLAGLLIDAGDLDGARKAIGDLGKTGVPEAFLDHLQGCIDYSQGKWLAAATRFDKVRPALVPWPTEARKVDLLLAECYGKLGRLKDQRDAYLRCAATDRTWMPALLGLAETKAKAGQIEEAVEDYRLILRLGNAPPAVKYEVARLLYLKNSRLPESERNWNEVETALNEAEQAGPGGAAGLLLRAELLVAKNDPQEATRLLTGLRQGLVEKAQKCRAEGQKALSEAETLSGEAKAAKLAEAEKLLATARDNEAAQPALWQMLIGLAESQQDWTGAEAELSAAEKQLGDTPLMRATRAKHLVERHGKDAATDIRNLAENAGQFSPPERIQLWRELARLSYQAGDVEQAQKLCDRVLEAEPGNLEIQGLRFQIAAASQDLDAMQQILDKIKEVQQTPGAFWHYGEAVRLTMLAEKGGSDKLLDDAQASLAKSLELQPNWAQAKLLAALLHERRHDENAALEAYLQAIDLGINDPNTIRHVAQLLSAKNRFREADHMFRLLGETQPTLSDEAGRELRSVKARLGEFEQAADVARKIASSSDKFEDHIWLGQLLSVVGRQAASRQQTELAKKSLAEAEEALRQAVLLKSDAAETWVALVQFYGQTGQLDKAERILAQAKRRLDPAQATAALAQCYDVLGKTDEAARQYELAVAGAPKDPAIARLAFAFHLRGNQTDKAEAQLNRFLDGTVDANDAQKTWARQALASMYLARGDAEGQERALKLIEQNLRLNPTSAQDQYMRAVMLASDASGKRRREAIDSLEKFLATQSNPDSEIQYVLATLYLAEDDSRKFKTLMRALLKEHKSVRYVQTFADMLVKADELDEAAVWVAELEKSAPDAEATVALESELAFRQGRFDSVRKRLQDWADRAAGDPARQEPQLPAAARMLEGFARRLRDSGDAATAATFSKEAQSVYQRYVDLKPGQELLMAMFFARQQRLGEALDLIEAKAPTSDPVQLATACFAMLDRTGPAPEQLRRVDRILEAALEKHKQSVPLLVALAILRDFEGQYDVAETIYRDILAKEPENPTVLNNLAVLLALERKNLDEASKLIDLAIAKVGPTAGLLDSRAMVRIAMEKPELALADLQQAIQKGPTAALYFHQAQAYQQRGQRTSAVEALAKAESLGLKEEHLQAIERAAYKRLMVTLK